MALSLAFCASMAFAQAPGQMVKQRSQIQHQLAFEDLKNSAVDYKASIFTKDGTIDTLRTFSFSQACMDSITLGTITASDRIDDTIVGAAHAHGLTANIHKWMRISDSNTFVTTAPTLFPEFSRWNNSTAPTLIATTMGPANLGSDNGFMFLSLSEEGNGRDYNCYFAMPAVANPNANNNVIEIRLSQWLYKFYEHEYIDYKVGGQWYSREINVNGVDVETNSRAATFASYTMPLAVANQASIEIRVRLYVSLGNAAAYGYAWAVDDVAIVSNTNPARWRMLDAAYIDGFYGTIPAGMQIPLAYGLVIQNQGRNAIPNTEVTISAAAENGTWQEVASTSPITVPNNNNLDTTATVYLNEHGFLDVTEPEIHFQHYVGMQQNYGSTTGLGNFAGRSLPTTTEGKNFFTVTVTSDDLTREFDTIAYTVSEFLERSNASDTRAEGYRWGRDNGIIASGSFFAPQWLDRGYLDHNWAAGNNHHAMSRYYMHVRYVTGDVIPETNGQTWCLRGMEIVPSTILNAQNIAGAVIMPIILEETYDAEGIDLNDVSCGIDEQTFTLTGNEANVLATGVIMPNADYNSWSIQFPVQPELKPNTAYRFGYFMAQAGNFAPAGTEYYYRRTADSIERYDRNPQTAPYFRQVGPATPFDVLVYDPYAPTLNGVQRSRTLYSWSYFDNFPLIRPIVGEPAEMTPNNILIDCSNNTDDHGFAVEHSSSQEPICNDYVPANVGSSISMILFPVDSHSVITHVYVNDVEITVSDPDDIDIDNIYMLEDDYNVEDEVTGITLLYRKYYRLVIPNVAEPSVMTYTVRATTEYREFNTGSIDNITTTAMMSLSPNPATSTVKLNLSGVTGMVDCSIIDMSGRVVYNANVNAESENVINVSEIPAGAYFVRVTNNSFSKIEKLIIK